MRNPATAGRSRHWRMDRWRRTRAGQRGDALVGQAGATAAARREVAADSAMEQAAAAGAAQEVPVLRAAGVAAGPAARLAAAKAAAVAAPPGAVLLVAAALARALPVVGPPVVVAPVVLLVAVALDALDAGTRAAPAAGVQPHAPDPAALRRLAGHTRDAAGRRTTLVPSDVVAPVMAGAAPRGRAVRRAAAAV